MATVTAHPSKSQASIQGLGWHRAAPGGGDERGFFFLSFLSFGAMCQALLGRACMSKKTDCSVHLVGRVARWAGQRVGMSRRRALHAGGVKDQRAERGAGSRGGRVYIYSLL